jgi:AcrR family transcriptional regulator
MNRLSSALAKEETPEPPKTADAAAVNQNGQRIGAKGRRTRQRLIDVTIALLETHGLRDLTVAEVARTAETSPATFYVYFEGVPEVVLAALENAEQSGPALLSVLEQDLCGEGGLAIARKFVQMYCDIWNANRTIFRVRNLAAEEGDPRFLDARYQAARPIMEALVPPIERAQAAGRVAKELRAISTAGAILTLLERLAAVGPMTRRENGLTFDSLIDASSHMVAHVLGAA